MARSNRKHRRNEALSLVKPAAGADAEGGHLKRQGERAQTMVGLDRFGDTHTLTRMPDGTWTGALNDAADEDGNPRPMAFTVPDVVAKEWERRYRERQAVTA